jgi:hypothetical protein
VFQVLVVVTMVMVVVVVVHRSVLLITGDQLSRGNWFGRKVFQL